MIRARQTCNSHSSAARATRCVPIATPHRLISIALSRPLPRARTWVTTRASAMSPEALPASSAGAPPPGPLPATPSAAVPEVPAGMEHEAEVLQALCGVPNVTRLTVRPGEAGWRMLTVYLSQRNLPGNSQYKSTVHVAVSDAAGAVASQPIELPGDLLYASPSPSGSRQLNVKSPGSSDNSASLVLQLWRDGRMASELLVPKGLHGGLINDGYFASGVAWAGSEDAVAYAAETPVREKTPAWGGPDSLKDAAGPKSWRGVGPALEDWGELNTGKRAPGVFVLDLKRKEVLPVPITIAGSDAESEMSFGQPVWTRDGGGLVIAGWPHYAPNFPAITKKLGIVFCYNRPVYLYYVPASRDAADGKMSFGAAVSISKDHHGSATWPTFSPDGSQLIYLCHDIAVQTGTHGATVQLCSMPWPQAASGACAPHTLIGVIDRASSPHGSAAFPGLYANARASDEPFFAGGAALLLNTQWRAQSAIIAVHATTGHVAPLVPLRGSGAVNTDCCSYSVLATSGREVYASRVSPGLPPQVIVATLPSDEQVASNSWWASGDTALDWSPLPGLNIGRPQGAADALAAMRYEVVDVTPTVGDTTLTFESVNFLPAGSEAGGSAGPYPTIIAPHGGPHTGVTSGWYMPYAYLASLGYAVICPNYRGSTGYGQASLASLPGNIGTNDVADCMAALQQAVDAGHADPSRVAVVGGSHGGFLTGHLLGQYPDAFKAGVLRNPVCNLSLMVGLSDISDWCYVEVFGSEEGMAKASGVPSPEVLTAMFAKSPIAHVHKVKAPMFFMLGAKDRRVPPPDGLQYLAALRGSGVVTAPPRVVTFPDDGHGLDKPQTEFEQWLSALWWLRTHGCQ
ncbi:hypothetical protein FOA52_012314 [Chlamydomonas sp. UWO 241]|nr:hypothetical protein FOA52_012314 [Chlamydomonas sp. UWO 241]